MGQQHVHSIKKVPLIDWMCLMTDFSKITRVDSGKAYCIFSLMLALSIYVVHVVVYLVEYGRISIVIYLYIVT